MKHSQLKKSKTQQNLQREKSRTWTLPPRGTGHCTADRRARLPRAARKREHAHGGAVAEGNRSHSGGTNPSAKDRHPAAAVAGEANRDKWRADRSNRDRRRGTRRAAPRLRGGKTGSPERKPKQTAATQGKLASGEDATSRHEKPQHKISVTRAAAARLRQRPGVWKENRDPPGGAKP
jgi:hypothetical protein